MEGVTWEYLHLIANPFPVVLSVTGAAVGLAGWLSGRERLERYGVLSLLIAGILAVPAYVTGLSAADVAGGRTFVAPSRIETHRIWATWAGVLLLSTACFAAFSTWEGEDRRLRRFVLLLGILAAALSIRVGWLGGRITHGPEAMERADAPATSTSGSVEVEPPPASDSPGHPVPSKDLGPTNDTVPTKGRSP